MSRQNIDVYHMTLIDDLNVLWELGIETWDVSRSQNFQMRTTLLLTINNFPAYGVLSGWSTHGKLSCPIYTENTQVFCLQYSGKHS